MKLLLLGHGATTSVHSVRWIVPLEGSAMKRLRKEREFVVDATQGRAAASLIGLDNHEVIVSSVSAEALQRRLTKVTDREG